MTFLKTVFMLICIGASLAVIYSFWMGRWPDRMQGTPSASGIAVNVEVTGTRGPLLDFQTTLILEVEDGDRFVYDVGALSDQDGVDSMVQSMAWQDDNTLMLNNYPKKRTVTILYTNQLWSLTECSMAP